jgi:hypothetical protein
MASSLRVNSIVPSSGTNVAIGTAGGTITYNASVSGISTFSSGIVVSAGSTSAPSISPSGDSNTGIFFPSADTIAFAEGGVEILRVNSSGNIGIGTTDSLNKFEVGNVSGGVTAPDFTVSTVSLGSSVTIGRLSSVGSDNTLFRVRDRVNRTLISATVGGVDIGSTDVTTPLTIRNGNLVFSTAGTGIDFSATANSSGTMTSELLDDYEEGTWTPTIVGFDDNAGGAATFNTLSGRYTKIGNTVFLDFYIKFNTAYGTASTVYIENLPFALSNLSYGSPSGEYTRGSGTSSYQDIISNTLQFYGYQSLSRFIMYYNGSTTFVVSDGASVANKFIIGGFWYQTN